MRTDSHLAVGSPMARAIAIAIATILLAIAVASVGVAGQQLLAANGPIIVDQSGEGDFSTIGEAIEAAVDGDVILVKAGTYAESITVDKDIALRGEDRDRVILELIDAVLITVAESNGEITDLTLRGDTSTQGMIVQGGAPTVTNVVFDGTGRPWNGEFCLEDEPCGGSLMLDGAAARVMGNQFLAGGEVSLNSGGTAIIEDNVLEGGPHIYLESIGPEVIVRGNRISGTLDRGIGLSSPGNVLIEGNHVSPAEGVGIRVGRNTGAEGYEPTIRGNTIEGADYGIEVTENGAPVIDTNTLSGNGIAVSAIQAASDITGNTLTDNRTGLLLGAGDHVVADNSIRGGEAGITITGGAAQVSGNSVEGVSNRGVVISRDAAPVLRDNRICDNSTNLWVAETASPDIDESNEICEDEPAE
jgi:parallel beta-helix repeat protein